MIASSGANKAVMTNGLDVILSGCSESGITCISLMNDIDQAGSNQESIWDFMAGQKLQGLVSRRHSIWTRSPSQPSYLAWHEQLDVTCRFKAGWQQQSMDFSWRNQQGRLGEICLGQARGYPAAALMQRQQATTYPTLARKTPNHFKLNQIQTIPKLLRALLCNTRQLINILQMVMSAATSLTVTTPAACV